MPLYHIELLDAEGKPVGTGMTGEICIKTSDKVPCGLFQGYLNNPEKTAEEWEREFLAAVDQMSEWAFHDACTGCNPVYPTIGELKGCYLKAFYGEKKYAEKYGDTWEIPVTLPTDTHAAYPMGLCADLGVAKTGGFN